MEGLLANLLSPFVDRLWQLAGVAAAADLRGAEQIWPVLEGYLDAVHDHRGVVGVVVADPSAAACEPVRLMRAGTVAVQDALARSRSGPDAHIRTASALGAVRAAVLEHDGGDVDTLRAVVTDAAVAILLSVPGTETGL